MGLDFDALEYCKNVKIKQTNPPYGCPVFKCDRRYKSVIGLQYHLLNYDHDNPQPLTPVMTPNRKKARSRGTNHATPKGAGATGAGGAKGDDEQNGGKGGASGRRITNPESLVSYNDEEQTVTFNIEGKSVRLGIHDPLPFIDEEEYLELVERGCIVNADKPPLELNAPWTKVKVPEATFNEIDNYSVADAPSRSLAYYRFIEKSAEELDGEIEYDVDEEDSAWLEWMNEEREKTGHNSVNIDTMELLMDRLEKESFFQAAANGTATGTEVDDDAVCCICMDGECQNTNVILFCDMCNLAVHQDCYGVPYIPEGQWLCRRCLQSPSTPVSCVLCPNTGGAFKQTDRGQWAHVVCALWIPEVRFANTVFLEPIDSIETIPAARWRLTCYVCKEKGMGACIQCHRNSCYAAFHVTCAQQAGLYMTMDMNETAVGHDTSAHVQKYAFCHSHTPDHAKTKLNLKDFENARHKMKEARKALAKKRSTAPVVLIPTIPHDRIQEIASMVHMQKKKEFLDRLIAYWTMKRKYRNGVPLLRRLQSQGNNNHGVIQRNGIEGSPDTSELYRQLKYWQCLRQDLERARLLCELVRKREKLKAAYVNICEQVVWLQLNPLKAILKKLLDALEARDTSEIFRDPVNTEEVPDYLDIVTQPMDLGTMRKKLDDGSYSQLDLLQADFDIMIQNCLAYNNKDTVFYRAGIRMRDQATSLFQQVRSELAREGLLDSTRTSHIDHVEKEVEDELKMLLAAAPCEAIVQKLLILADKSQVLKNPTYRTKKIKQIRLEITRMRKGIQKARLQARHNTSVGGNSQTEDDEEMEENHNVEDMDVDTPPPVAQPTPPIASAVKSQKHQQEQQQQHEITPKTRTRRPSRAALASAASAAATRRGRRQTNQHHRHLSDDDDEDDAEEEDELEHMSMHVRRNRHCSDDEEEDGDTLMADGDSKSCSNNTTQTPPCSPVKSCNSSASPVGVNRRTTVLFTRKAQAALKRPSEPPTTPVKEESNTQKLHHQQQQQISTTSTPNSLMSCSGGIGGNGSLLVNAAGAAGVAFSQNNAASALSAASTQQTSLVSSALSISNKLSSGLNQLTPLTASLNQVTSTPLSAKSPKRNAGRHKRLTEMRNNAAMSPKKSPNRTSAGVIAAVAGGAGLLTTAITALQQQQQHPVENTNSNNLTNSNNTNNSSSSLTAANLSNFQQISEKFRVYRTNNERDASDSDDDDMSDISGSPCSSCSGFSASCSGTDYDSSDDDDEEEEEDEEEVEEGNEDNAENNENNKEANVDMHDNTSNAATDGDRSMAGSVAKGQAMSCSDDEGNGGENDSDTQTRIITRRTPMPEEKRTRNTARNKQKKKTVASAVNAAPATTTTATTNPAKTTTVSTAASTATTRSSSKARTATPTPNNLNNTTTTTTTTSTIKTRRSTHKDMQQNSNANNNNNSNNNNNNSSTKTRFNNSLNKESSPAINAGSERRQSIASHLAKPPLEPLQLVWAKCRGYPWYPALILDPKTPKGFVYNGVPLPAPPTDVLALRKNQPSDELVFLVLFFDAKRTWQWLPANKLEILGIDKKMDQQKLVESRKPTERKAVKKAYQDALLYQSQVSDLEGQGPDPIM